MDLAMYPFLLAAALLASDASAHPAPAPEALQLFESRVRPLLAEKCFKCHSTGAEKLRGGLLLDSRAGWAKGGESGPVIAPGEPEKSLLVKAVRYEDPALQMPPSGKLAERDVAALVEWIRLGAPDPRAAPEAAPAAKPQRVIDIEEGRKHWAFQPLASTAPPEVKDASWCRGPADRFVLARIEAAGLAPGAEADRRTLLRRAFFDVTGLPPSPEEADAFFADASPSAYEGLVHRLLESPRFGERWARHWLDLARFGESHGFEHDYDRPNAYPYRDFVIRALNEDLPYDVFVRWQIAGDELDPESPMALAATGFLGAGVHATQITKNQVEKERYDELDDVLATTGTAFLGLTLGCARCHDHKFDPIPTRDYYRMLSTFTTMVRSEQDVDLDPKGTRQALAKFDAEHAPLAGELARFEKEDLPGRLDAWLEARPRDTVPPDWVVLDVESAKSEGGAELKSLGDGSLLVQGKNPDHDTHVITARTGLRGITALRLEALAHESLVKGGPGRASNGNFALTELRVTAQPAAGGPPLQVKLKNARATFEQKGLPVAAAIDGDASSAWAVDPEFGKDHAAVFETDEPVGFDGGTVLTFTLKFENNTGHGIARPRLSARTGAGPVPLAGTARRESIDRILAAAGSGRPLSNEDRAALEDWYRPRDAEWLRRSGIVEAHQKTRPKPALQKMMISSEGVPAVRLHTQGDDFLPETHFLTRGDPNRKEGVAPQGFLQVLVTPPATENRWQEAPPAGSRTSWRRRAFAAWITDVDAGAGRLLARVIVNRIWRHYLGRGIVRTESDFGAQGERPVDPALLDWLAGELIRGGWRLKPIHELILTSAAYRQSAAIDEARTAADPEGKLFLRRQPRRLEAEAVRDTILALSGTLDLTMYGPGTLDPSMRRRSIYFFVKRSALVPMMLLFDGPDALQGLPSRAATTIAPQALQLLNSPFARDAARAFAAHVARDPDPPRAAYRIALAREPGAEELADARAFVRDQGLEDFCQVLFCLNELIYID